MHFTCGNDDDGDVDYNDDYDYDYDYDLLECKNVRLITLS